LFPNKITKILGTAEWVILQGQLMVIATSRFRVK
jgi:hypothetical protein